MSWLKSVRSKLALKHTPLNLIARQGITSIRGCMSRCKQRAKKRHGRLVTRVVRGGKKSKELNEEELLQDKWTSWRPERVTDEGYATSEYISCSRTAVYSMHESIYGARRLDSANRCWIASTFSFRSSVTQDGTYSQALTRHDSHRVIRTPSASRLLSLRLLLSHVSCVLIYYYFFFFLGILRNANDRCHFMM